MLNASKGPAVRGPRAQMDRKLYKQKMQQLLAAVPGLEIVDGAVTNVLLDGRAGPSSPTGQSPAEKAIAGVMLASGELANCMQGCGVTLLRLVLQHIRHSKAYSSRHQDCFIKHFLNSFLLSRLYTADDEPVQVYAPGRIVNGEPNLSQARTYSQCHDTLASCETSNHWRHAEHHSRHCLKCSIPGEMPYCAYMKTQMICR